MITPAWKRSLRKASGLGVALVIAAAAAAQNTEFTLEKSGQWVQQHAPEPGSDEAVIADTAALLASDQPEQAFTQIDHWINQHDHTENIWLPRAFLLRGDALVASGDEFKAMFDYERNVIQRFPQSDEFVRAIERELDIADRYAHGLRRKFLGIRLFRSYDIAEETLIRVQERLPGSSLAERAGIELANLYYRRNDLETASIAYDLYIQNFPSGQSVPLAMERRIRANVAKYKGPEYNGSSLIDAEEQTKIFQRNFPSRAEQTGLDDRLTRRLEDAAADQMLQGARWYLKRKDQASARFMLRRLLRRHPDAPAAAEALKVMRRHGWDAPERTDTNAAAAATPIPSENPS